MAITDTAISMHGVDPSLYKVEALGLAELNNFEVLEANGLIERPSAVLASAREVLVHALGGDPLHHRQLDDATLFHADAFVAHNPDNKWCEGADLKGIRNAVEFEVGIVAMLFMKKHRRTSVAVPIPEVTEGLLVWFFNDEKADELRKKHIRPHAYAAATTLRYAVSALR